MSPALHCNSGTQHCQPVDPEPGPAYVSAHVLFYMDRIWCHDLADELTGLACSDRISSSTRIGARFCSTGHELSFCWSCASGPGGGFFLFSRWHIRPADRPGGSKEENPGYPRSRYLLILGNEVTHKGYPSGGKSARFFFACFQCFFNI